MTSNWRNNSIYNSNMNLRFLFEIMIFEIFQSTTSRRFSKTLTHWMIVQMNFLSMQMIRLKNLQITDITTSNFSRNLKKFRMKSIMKMWKNIEIDKIDYKKSYDLCRLIWWIWQFEQWRKYSRNCLKKSRMK